MAHEMMQSEHGKNFIKEFMEKWWTIGVQWQKVSKNQISNSIKDEDITEVYKNLRNAHSIEDMLGKNE